MGSRIDGHCIGPHPANHVARRLLGRAELRLLMTFAAIQCSMLLAVYRSFCVRPDETK